MNATQPAKALDRFVGTLLDRDHPFWTDERQRAVYGEACAAAMVLQALAVVFVGGCALLIGGKPVVGAVTALVLAATCGQWLILAVLTRRNVEVFPRGWRTQTSPTRKAVTLVAVLFYLGAYLFISVRSKSFGEDTASGLLVGIGFVALVVGLVAWFQRRNHSR